MRIVYIDESGTVGFRKNEPFFIIAAVIFNDEAALKRAKNIIKKARDARPGALELHANKMKMAQEQVVLTELASQPDYQIAYIAVNKLRVSKKLYQHKNVMYNFLLGVLMKRILAKCDEDVRIITDSRSTKVTSTDSLCDYLRAKAYGDWKFAHDLSIEQAESHTHFGLQAADLIASPIFVKYNYKMKELYNLNLKHYIIREKFPSY